MSSSSPVVLDAFRRALVTIAVALVYGFLAWVSILFSRNGGQVAVIWLPGAMLVAAGLTWRLGTLRLFLAALVSHISLLFLLGRPPGNTLGLAVASALEVALVLLLSRNLISHPEHVKEPRRLARFLGIAMLAAAAAGLFSATAIALFSGNFLVIWWQWWLAHAMAMMTLVPILLVLEAERQNGRRHGLPLVTLRGGADILLGCVAIAGIFAQTSYPLLFLAAPVILAVAARHGTATSAFMLLATTLIATLFTLAGFGPVNLIHDSVHVKIAILQIFIIATFISTLPVTLAHDQIAQLRERTLTLIETMDEMPFALDLAGRWTYLARHAAKLFGRDRRLPLGARALTIVPRDKRRIVLSALASLRAGDIEEAHFDFVGNIDTPHPPHLSMRVRLLRKRDGSIEGYVGIIRDMSQEAASERALAASEQRLISLAENAPVGVFQFDNEGNATFLNAEWARMHGMTVEEGLGKGWQRIFDAQQLAHYESFEKVRQAGETTDIDSVVRRPDGSACHIRAVTTALRDSDGKLIGRMGVVVDQTREYEAQAALQSTLEEARSAAVAKDRFLALMSHELRTPMNGVLGFAERLQETPLSDSQRRYVSLIARSGEIMLTLLNDILDTSRMREGQLKLVHEPYDLAATMTGVCAHFEPLAARRGLQLRCNFASPLPKQVRGDKQRLTQILNNLLGNALKFTENGWISVYARIETQYGRTILIVEVTDTGMGIAPENKERVFEAFDQGAEDTGTRFGGTGLGLPIARGLAQQMQGSLDLITSNPGKGSIFRLTLPLDIPADATKPQDIAPAEPQRKAAPKDAPRLRVLAAEDNEINRFLIADVMESLGCDLSLVADGQQAVDAVTRAIAERSPFDLVLMDLRMPVLDGVGATRAIRSAEIGPDVLPIIAVTANVHPDAMTACWDAGMQDYVTKPITRTAIEAALQKWGRKGAASPAPAASEPSSSNIPPELAPLLGRFTAQCNDCLGGVQALLDGWPDVDRDQFAAVHGMVHSVAGLAATFAAPELIAPAQALDMAMTTDEADRTRQALEKMHISLVHYLASCAPEAKAS